MSEETKNKAIDKCCGSFPKNDCEHCGHIAHLINEIENKSLQWVSAMKDGQPLCVNLLITDTAGINRTGNFFENEDGNICLWISGTPFYEEYVVPKEKLYGYFWLKETIKSI